MSDLKDMVRRYTIKHDHQIKNICTPLQEIGISVFGYLKIDSDGRIGNLTNYPEQLDFYYSEKIHLDNPFFVHPHLLRSGCAFTTCAFTPEGSERISKIFQMYRIFIILQRTGDSVEGFIFSQKNLTLDQGLNFYSHLELMHKFAFYFKREAKQLIEQMMSDGFNIKQERGDSFFLADPRQPLVRKNPHFLKVLRTISPLSDREQECLSLFQQGFSAQATAAVLHLSQRTVEHYFDTIKNKLGCSSKWELLAR